MASPGSSRLGRSSRPWALCRDLLELFEADVQKRAHPSASGNPGGQLRATKHSRCDKLQEELAIQRARNQKLEQRRIRVRVSVWSQRVIH